MKNKAIPRRDAKVKLFIDILSETTWNIPNDFAVSIRTYDYEVDDKYVAVGHLSLFPNDPKYFMDSAMLKVLAASQALSLLTTFESRHGSPCINVSIYISVER